MVALRQRPHVRPKCLLGAVLAVACACTEKNRSTDTLSSTLPDAKARAAFLCSYALCASPVQDAVFHVVYQDNSGGLISGPDDAEIHAVLKVAKDDVEQWARGCVEARVAARPEWLGPLVKGTRLSPTSAPDGYRCGAETRALHVKEGLIVRWIHAD
jgi:hypothetical protein